MVFPATVTLALAPIPFPKELVRPISKYVVFAKFVGFWIIDDNNASEASYK